MIMRQTDDDAADHDTVGDDGVADDDAITTKGNDSAKYM